MKVFGKTLKEYFLPIWPFALISVIIVISQYTIALPFQELQSSDLILRLTQALWELMVALSVIILVRKYDDFGIKNLFFIGVFYSFLIHGLKVTIRYLFYGKDLPYIIDRFAYGSFLVMLVALGIGTIFLYVKKNKIKLF